MLINCSTLLMFISIVASVLGDDISDEWISWKSKFGKSYSSNENNNRFELWRANRLRVKEHNAKYAAGQSTFLSALNKFSDMTSDEFRKMLIPTKSRILPHSIRKPTAQDSPPPDSLDWRNSGLVTSVKDQGQIGSCYSFSAIGAVEGQYSKETGRLISFSEQQIVDCNQGDDGGYPFKVYKYLARHGGSETEQDYPYVAKEQSCNYNKSKSAAVLNSYNFACNTGDETGLQLTLSQVGPVSVSDIEVFDSFQFYRSGVYYEPKCNDKNNDGEGYHAMVATGYGTENGQDYWMTKNSWGTGWGEDGYIKMSRNRDNNCGIASQATYPLMASAQPAVVQATTPGRGEAVFPSLLLLILTVFYTLQTI